MKNINYRLLIRTKTFFINETDTICILNFYDPILKKLRKSKATVKWNKSDNYDKVKGQRLAESRAIINMTMMVKKSLRDFNRKMRYKLNNIREKEKVHINNLLHD
jgi:hypothetical protein